jgi:hypothetical protein
VPYVLVDVLVEVFAGSAQPKSGLQSAQLLKGRDDKGLAFFAAMAISDANLRKPTYSSFN